MVLGSDSMPLDVGRQQRLATAALRDALTPRDRGCAFPSCDRPPRYCHAHHIVPWLNGGETNYPTDPLLDVPPETPGVGALLRGRTRGMRLSTLAGRTLIPECISPLRLRFPISPRRGLHKHHAVSGLSAFGT